jgi:DNA processing protein
VSADVAEPAPDVPPDAGWPDGFAEREADVRAALVLSALQGMTPRRLLSVAAGVGSASAVLAEIREGRVGSANDRAFASSLDGAEIAAAAAACDARVVPWGSEAYPDLLRHIPDPPALLYVVGHGLVDVARTVAVVGARRCSERGREAAFEIGRGLGLAGAIVVSGAALGIDAAAHLGALDAGGRTLAVMGCGIDRAYPPRSAPLIERIRRSGTIVSEHAPGTPPFPRNFPARNRIVAGLCAATVVVEGAAGSGSMITAEHAMEFGRDVYAVPGPVTSPLSAVPLQLIRDGAGMVRGSADLLEDLGLEPGPDEVSERLDLSEPERRILDRLDEPALPDGLAAATGATVPEVVATLVRLELRGLVRSVGGRFESTLRGRAASG